MREEAVLSHSIHKVTIRPLIIIRHRMRFNIEENVCYNARQGCPVHLGRLFSFNSSLSRVQIRILL